MHFSPGTRSASGVFKLRAISGTSSSSSAQGLRRVVRSSIGKCL